MKNNPHQEAALAYTGQLDGLDFIPVTAGLINQSWRVSDSSNDNCFFLQQINTHVFPNPQGIQQNYFLLWNTMHQLSPTFSIPQPLVFANGEKLFIDAQGGHWRVTEFLKNARTFQSPVSNEQLGLAASAYGNFAQTFAKLDTSLLTPAIVNFHNLSLRFRQFEEACQHALPDRKKETEELIFNLLDRKGYADRYEDMQQSPADFPLRVLHHDAKMSNLLFNADGDQVIAVVDLDTTMPGLFFSDLGDMIRSMAGTQGENSTDWNNLQLSPARYRALIQGYEFAMRGEFTKPEKEWIHYAGPIMLYMQALRFISDYLTGDHYYRIESPGQNSNRAKNQFQLLISLEELLRKEYHFSV